MITLIYRGLSSKGPKGKQIHILYNNGSFFVCEGDTESLLTEDFEEVVKDLSLVKLTFDDDCEEESASDLRFLESSAISSQKDSLVDFEANVCLAAIRSNFLERLLEISKKIPKTNIELNLNILLASSFTSKNSMSPAQFLELDVKAQVIFGLTKIKHKFLDESPDILAHREAAYDFSKILLSKIFLALKPLLDSSGSLEEESSRIISECRKAARQKTFETLYKGISGEDMTRLSQYWHANRQQQKLKKLKDYGGESWESLFGSKILEVPRDILSNKEDGWRVVTMTSLPELREEGLALSHCVEYYSEDCLYLDSHILSIVNPAKKKVGTIEIKAESGEMWAITNVGFSNAPPSKEAKEIEAWLLTQEVDYEKLNIKKALREQRQGVTKEIGFNPFDRLKIRRALKIYKEIAKNCGVDGIWQNLKEILSITSVDVSMLGISGVTSIEFLAPSASRKKMVLDKDKVERGIQEGLDEIFGEKVTVVLIAAKPEMPFGEVTINVNGDQAKTSEVAQTLKSNLDEDLRNKITSKDLTVSTGLQPLPFLGLLKKIKTHHLEKKVKPSEISTRDLIYKLTELKEQEKEDSESRQKEILSFYTTIVGEGGSKILSEEFKRDFFEAVEVFLALQMGERPEKIPKSFNRMLSAEDDSFFQNMQQVRDFKKELLERFASPSQSSRVTATKPLWKVNAHYSSM